MQNAVGTRRSDAHVAGEEAVLPAVRADADWPLVFPLSGDEPGGEVVERAWSGSGTPRRCRVLRRVGARALWDQIMRAAYDYAEPGVIFIDRVNRMNNLWYCEWISATNPCGEIPLPHYGACNLGAINLTQFVRRPFMADGEMDLEGISATVATAVRLLDNVYDLSHNSTSTPPVAFGWRKAILAPPAPFLGTWSMSWIPFVFSSARAASMFSTRKATC